MMRGIYTIVTFVSVLLFPWPVAAVLAFVSALHLPLLPLAIGIFFDTLYYTKATGFLPLGSMCGVLVSTIALFVRSRLNPGIIGR